MHPEYPQSKPSPFSEESDPELFFPGAEREAICQSMILDILAGKPLVKLIGREGAGKTMVCQVVADRLPSEYEIVVLDNPVGSFDDLMRVVCIELGMDPRGQRDGFSPAEDWLRLVEHKNEEGVKVVLIVDEAEKLFLATLERLVVLLGESPEDLAWTMVLSGRPGLEANLARLSILSVAVDIHSGYTLEELTEGETRRYLRFRLEAAGMDRDQVEVIFPEGVVAKIFATSRGNLRMINILAEETLRTAEADRSFMVLLDRVEPEEVQEDKGPGMESRILELYDLLRANRVFAGALAGLVVVVFLLGVLLTGNRGGDDETAGPAAVSQETAASAAVTGERAVSTPAGASPETGPSAIGGSGQRDGDQLLRERLAASAHWLTGIHKGKYTVQLMLLVSNQAQMNVADTLVQDDYFAIREQLFVFRKNTTPPTILVFHGLYNTLDEAREARNNMPVFLRRHHPYPLAVDDALKKLHN